MSLIDYGWNGEDTLQSAIALIANYDCDDRVAAGPFLGDQLTALTAMGDIQLGKQCDLDDGRDDS